MITQLQDFSSGDPSEMYQKITSISSSVKNIEYFISWKAQLEGISGFGWNTYAQDEENYNANITRLRDAIGIPQVVNDEQIKNLWIALHSTLQKYQYIIQENKRFQELMYFMENSSDLQLTDDQRKKYLQYFTARYNPEIWNVYYSNNSRTSSYTEIELNFAQEIGIKNFLDEDMKNIDKIGEDAFWFFHRFWKGVIDENIQSMVKNKVIESPQHEKATQIFKEGVVDIIENISQ